eukprot:7129513-Prymnesium_polylepis.1
MVDGQLAVSIVRRRRVRVDRQQCLNHVDVVAMRDCQVKRQPLATTAQRSVLAGLRRGGTVEQRPHHTKWRAAFGRVVQRRHPISGERSAPRRVLVQQELADARAVGAGRLRREVERKHVTQVAHGRRLWVAVEKELDHVRRRAALRGDVQHRPPLHKQHRLLGGGRQAHTYCGRRWVRLHEQRMERQPLRLPEWIVGPLGICSGKLGRGAREEPKAQVERVGSERRVVGQQALRLAGSRVDASAGCQAVFGSRIIRISTDEHLLCGLRRCTLAASISLALHHRCGGPPLVDVDLHAVALHHALDQRCTVRYRRIGSGSEAMNDVVKTGCAAPLREQRREDRAVDHARHTRVLFVDVSDTAQRQELDPVQM